MITPVKKLKTVHVIVNPIAGKKKESTPEVIREAMERAGIVVVLSTTEGAGDALRFAKEAVESGADAVAVCGGDGTVLEVGNGLVESDIPLLILPGGSANVLATELGIPKSVEEACGILAESRYEIRSIDAARFHKGCFFGRAALGFEADMVRSADRKTKNRFGVLAYFVAGLRALKKLRLAEYTIRIDGEDYFTRGLTCIVTNAGNLGFSRVSLDKNVDVSDGLLDVIVVKKASLGLVGHIAATFWRGERADNWDLVAHWQGKDIHVTSKPRQRLECDGEMFDNAPFHAQVIAGGLRMVVPKAAPKLEETPAVADAAV